MATPKFVRVRLDETALTLFGDLQPENMDVFAWALDMVEDGYKISMSCRTETGSFACYMTGAKESVNEGKTVGQWGGSIEECLLNLWLIHDVFATKHDWESANDQIKKRVKEVVRQLKER